MKINDRKKPNNTREHKINSEIRSKVVYLISETGEKHGNISFFDALGMANDKGLDLVQIAINENIPVCKLMDYGKFCFEQKKMKKLSKKDNKLNEKKIIQINPAMADNDFKIKLNKVVEFLQAGYKVNILMKLKGRQVDYPEISMNMFNECIAFCGKLAKVETTAKIEGKKGIMVLAPNL